MINDSLKFILETTGGNIVKWEASRATACVM